MKRGLITWDRQELPAAALEARLARAKSELAKRDLPALVVYSDVTRSNQARYLTNFMPYWNRSLAVIPRDQAPVLLCALSPRVYPWIRSVTVFEEIRPAGKLVQSLGQLCGERGWTKIGVLDQAMLPYDLNEQLKKSGIETADVSSEWLVADESEIAMRRRGAALARKILEDAIDSGRGSTDRELCGGLEREFRRAGAEDLMILIGSGIPRPASGKKLGDRYSVCAALEYRGHWVKVTRARGGDGMRVRFEQALKSGGGRAENLSGPYPAMSCDRSTLQRDSIYSLHIEEGGLMYGDTCIGAALL